MKIRRILKIILAAIIIYALVAIASLLRQRQDRTRPNSPAIPNVPLIDIPIIDPVLGVDHWARDGANVEFIQWSNVYNSVPGTVRLEKWTSADRTYYQIQGPISPDYGKSSSEYPICQVFLPKGFETVQWQIRLSDEKLVATAQHGSMRQSVPARQIKADVKNAYITICFWVAKGQVVGNIVFNYEEDEYVGWLATERLGAREHNNFLNWIMP